MLVGFEGCLLFPSSKNIFARFFWDNRINTISLKMEFWLQSDWWGFSVGFQDPFAGGICCPCCPCFANAEFCPQAQILHSRGLGQRFGQILPQKLKIFIRVPNCSVRFLCQAFPFPLLQEVTTWGEMGIHAGDVTWIQNLTNGTKTECSKVQTMLVEMSLEQL